MVDERASKHGRQPGFWSAIAIFVLDLVLSLAIGTLFSLPTSVLSQTAANIISGVALGLIVCKLVLMYKIAHFGHQLFGHH